MKKIVLLLALFTSLVSCAQREYYGYEPYYDVGIYGYRTMHGGVCYDKYAEVRNRIIMRWQIPNYHVEHVANYCSCQCRSGINCGNCYELNGFVGKEQKEWFFFFNLDSDVLKNKEELGHLIYYAKTHPNSVISIEAYADIGTGTYSYNMGISKRRSITIANYLIGEGIDERRLHINYYGSSIQEYRNNSLNRCVIVKVINV